MDFYDATEVRAGARGNWAAVLSGLGVDASRLRNVHGPCPGCGGRDRFRFDDQGGAGTFLCSQGGGSPLSGDGIALLMHVRGWTDTEGWKRAVNELGAAMGLQPRQGTAREPREPVNPGVAPEPVGAKAPGRPVLNMRAVDELTRGMEPVDREWLRRRSPIPPEWAADPGEFLNRLYAPGERVLVFTDQRSQGDFLWVAGMVPPGTPSLRGGWRLAQERGVAAVRSSLPSQAAQGVWFLVQPVKGQWAVKPDVRFEKEAGGEGVRREVRGTFTRRSAVNVTAWRFFVLESDELPEAQWLRVLASLPLPIAAIYTSGGRSVHALVKFPQDGKAAWDLVRDQVRSIVCPLGADPGALSAVRLSRLPGCKRGDRMQELLYLDPEPEMKAMRLRPEVRW